DAVELVVDEAGHHAAVVGLADGVPGGVVGRRAGALVGGADRLGNRGDAAEGVVGVGGDPAQLIGLGQHQAAVVEGAAEAVAQRGGGHGGEAAGVVGGAADAARLVTLGDDAAQRVVLVAAGEAQRVGHRLDAAGGVAGVVRHRAGAIDLTLDVP